VHAHLHADGGLVLVVGARPRGERLPLEAVGGVAADDGRVTLQQEGGDAVGAVLLEDLVQLQTPQPTTVMKRCRVHVHTCTTASVTHLALELLRRRHLDVDHRVVAEVAQLVGDGLVAVLAQVRLVGRAASGSLAGRVLADVLLSHAHKQTSNVIEKQPAIKTTGTGSSIVSKHSPATRT